MCTVCGCGQGETSIEGHEHGHGDHGHEHRHADGTVHSHPHNHDGPHEAASGHDHSHGGPAHQHGHRHADGTWHDHSHVHEGDLSHVHGKANLDFGAGAAGASAPGVSQARMVQVEQDILSKNNTYAAANRRRFADRGVFAVNLVSSPGSGKTTLLVRTIEALKARRAIGVVEGDQQTSFDAERIRATGVAAIQINTGKGCHLDAHMVGHAWEGLHLPDDALLLIENVGNLVCPAEFDLGEAHKVVILSVTEGEDKPLKYPNMFRAADLMILNKVDLLPHLSFDVARCLDMARRVNPRIEILQVSASSGAGLESWLAWLEKGMEAAKAARASTVEQLRQHIADLEAQLAARQS